jgi:hypothetical protein
METITNTKNEIKSKRSTSEVGHAKNIANLNTLNANILALGAIYNPSNPKLQLVILQNTYTTASQHQENVNTLLAPYSFAVNDREILFKPLNKQLTKLRKAYKATEGVTQKELDNFMTISRKLKGIQKTTTATVTSEQEQTKHSTSQLSYDQRTNNMDLLISLLQNTPNYNPNEAEYKIEVLQAQKEEMLQKTQAVINTYIPLNNARSIRNKTLYNAEENLVDIANKAKDYLFTILDTNSTEYKAIARLQFRKD